LTIQLVRAGTFNIDVLLLPPFVFLDQVRRLLDGSGIRLGAQDVDWRDDGAVTGAVSAPMLRDLGCGHCLVGHSERRNLFGETDELVADKFAACLAHGIVPILCVGETLEERQGDATLAVVTRQIRAVIDRVGPQGLENVIIAYEPVWAIGTGQTALPADANEVHAGIRAYIGAHDVTLGGSIRVLYGGSVNPDNAAGLLAEEDIDGALVGGASLDADGFAAICHAAATPAVNAAR
jgi:triosephosphate isomerase